MANRSLFTEAREHIDKELSGTFGNVPEWVIFRGLCILALAVLAVAQAINHNGRE